MSPPEDAVLQTTGEVAALFNVPQTTAALWGRSGHLLSVGVPGGFYRRHFPAESAALLRGESRERARELALAERVRIAGSVRGDADDVVLLGLAPLSALFRVAPKTVSRWGLSGALLALSTPGGHRRYFAAEVAALVLGETPEQARKIALADKARLTGGAV